MRPSVIYYSTHARQNEIYLWNVPWFSLLYHLLCLNAGQCHTLNIFDLLKIISSSKTKELRFSYELCDEEKDYVRIRKEEILKQVPKIFDEKQAPQNIDEVWLLDRKYTFLSLQFINTFWEIDFRPACNPT